MIPSRAACRKIIMSTISTGRVTPLNFDFGPLRALRRALWHAVARCRWHSAPKFRAASHPALGSKVQRAIPVPYRTDTDVHLCPPLFMERRHEKGPDLQKPSGPGLP